MDDFAAVMTSTLASLLLPTFLTSSMSVLGGTTSLQNTAYSTISQALIVSNGGPNLNKKGVVFQSDNIFNDAAMNMCIAASRVQWCTGTSGDKADQVIAVYGGKLIDDNGVLADIGQKIAGHKIFKIENSLFGSMDPWEGSRKSCCIFYSDSRSQYEGEGLFWRGMFAREGDLMDFATDIREIRWHNTYLKGEKFRQAYIALVTAKVARIPFRIDIDNMPFLQPDPAVGSKKRMIIRYKSINAVVEKDRNSHEGCLYDLARDIDWKRYRDWLVAGQPETYSQFFNRIDGESTAPIMIGNHLFGNRDPANRTRKKLYMSLRKGPGTDREEWQWEGQE